MVNKIKSVILGHSVADALGVPVEFCSREKLDERPITVDVPDLHRQYSHPA